MTYKAPTSIKNQGANGPKWVLVLCCLSKVIMNNES